MSGPHVSVIVQFFNRRDHVRPIAEALKRLDGVEIIVCDDGSIDGSHEKWLQQLRGSGGVIVRSNDLHEIRAYDRAAGLATGSVFCFLQDDDLPPADGAWVTDALALFAEHPKLGVLGGFKGYVFELSPDLPPTAKIAGRFEEPSFADRQLDLPFMFVQAVNLAPLFIRRETYSQTGYNYGFSGLGESGILFDQEICLRAWLAGWSVGLYRAPFRRRVGGRGTLVFSNESRVRNFERNLRLLANDYGNQLDGIMRQVGELNAGAPALRGVSGTQRVPKSIRLVSRAVRATYRAMERVRTLTGSRARLTRRVLAMKRARAVDSVPYRESPAVSVVLLSTGPQVSAGRVLDRLRQAGAEELVVADFGWSFSDTRMWLKRLTGPNDFLLRLADPSPRYALQRGIGLARGEIVCLWRTSEMPPADTTWLPTALDLFRRYDRLAVLAARQPQTIASRDPVSGVRFAFVESAAGAPMFLRREALVELPAFWQSVDAVNSWDDLPGREWCLSAWKAGWHVGTFGIADFAQSATTPGDEGPHVRPASESETERLVHAQNRRLVT